jgi:molybdopterin converting factor subunit 1
MMLTLQLFATLKERAGQPTIRIELPGVITVDALRAAVGAQYPALADLAARSVVSVNREFAFDEDPVRADDEVALFPPVSGG